MLKCADKEYAININKKRKIIIGFIYKVHTRDEMNSRINQKKRKFMNKRIMTEPHYTVYCINYLKSAIFDLKIWFVYSSIFFFFF